MFFFIEQGKNSIFIDLDNKFISSKTSLLSNENNESLSIKKYYDSINEINVNIIINNKDTFGLYKVKSDSINKLYHKAYFNWCLKHPKSFISLNFVNFMTYTYHTIGLTKEDINTLFNLLDLSLHNYPTYIKCKAYIAEYINNPNYELPNINNPLWSPTHK